MSCVPYYSLRAENCFHLYILRLEVSKKRAAEKADARSAWEATQEAEAEVEAQKLRAERDSKRASYQAAEEKLKQELALRVQKEKQLLAEKERALADERQRKARCFPRPFESPLKGSNHRVPGVEQGWALGCGEIRSDQMR